MWAFEALCCPLDRGELDLEAGGSLRCRRCGTEFPRDDGILRLLPERDSAISTDRQREAERQQRDREARRYDRLLGLRLLSLLEVPATLRPLQLSNADRVIEAGCGTGRMTIPLAQSGGCVVAVDHSFASLQLLQEKLPAGLRERVLLVQGDAAALPVKSGWGTAAVSSQMLEHLPSNELRQRAVGELARVLAAGGRAVLSAYWQVPGLGWLLAREGAHSGAIFFHRFHRDELRALIGAHFQVDQLSARLIYVLLAHARKRPGCE